MERIESIDDHKKVELMNGDGDSEIGSKMTKEMETLIVAFLQSNSDVFSWDSSDFRGISPEVIVHRLNVDPAARPIQQKKRTFGVEKNAIIKEEVAKLLGAGYISEVHYTDWLSNVVVVPKALGK